MAVIVANNPAARAKLNLNFLDWLYKTLLFMIAVFSYVHSYLIPASPNPNQSRNIYNISCGGFLTDEVD